MTFALATYALAAMVTASPADDIQSLLARAETAIAAGDLTAASMALDEALRLDGDDVDALYAAAVLARQDGRGDAVRLLTHLVELDPNADDARLQLALALWESGDTAGADEAVRRVLARHPELPDALDVQRRITAGPFARPSPWRLSGRFDLAAGYDSNLSLVSTALPEVSRQGVAVGLAEAALGVSYDTAARPFSAFVRLSSLQPLNHHVQAAPNAATVMGLGALGRYPFGPIEAALDLRYDEVFTDSFAIHRERVISPSLYGSIGLGGAQQLRVLVGGDYCQMLASAKSADGSASVEPSSAVLRADVRDSIVLGRWSFTLDALGRRASAMHDAAVAGASRNLDFVEVGAQGYAEAHLTDTLVPFVSASIARRAFSDSAVRPPERMVEGQAGLRASFDWLELHAEYAYTDNASAAKEWRWSRHAVFAGTRVYTP